MTTNKKSRKNKIFVAVIVLCALVLSVVTAVFATGKSEESYRTITVIEISGTVGVVHNDIEYAAYTGMHLEEGYTVVTSGSSYIRLLLDDDKYVKLEAGSKAVFEEVGKGKTAIRLERGSLISEITKSLDVDEDFIVNTPNAVLAVRGTLFRVNLERTENGELNTDVITYGGAVASKRVQPDGEVEDVEVTISEGFRATVNMDDKNTVYVVDDVKVDIDSLINSDAAQNNNSSGGDKNEGNQVDLSSVLMPISIEDIPDDDLVDIYFAVENGHDMFIENEDVSIQLEKRGIDITEQTPVYEVVEKIENPEVVIIPDDNVPLTTEKTEDVTEVVLGPPTDGIGTTTTHKHIEVTENISATCTSDGKIIVKCSECNKIMSETVVPATGHTTKTTRVNPTCTGNGSETTICTICNKTISETVVPATGHKAVYCGTKDAHTECENCRVVLTVAHSYDKVITKATCIENGKTTYKCACGYIYDEEIPATGHTEIEGGTKDAHTICETCGDALQTNHNYSEMVTKEAGCEENGEKTFTCSCGYSYKETINATGHTEVNGGTKDAHTICETCGDTVQTNHKYSETVTKEAGCEETGEKTFSCSCGYSYKGTINATGHTEINGATKDAHTICKTCGKVMGTAHNMTETVNTKEDCVTDGSYTYSCDCGYSYTETVPALGHTETNAGEADVHTKCSVCGVALKDGTYHSYTEEVTTENSCTTEGELMHTCACGWSYTEDIEPSHKQSDDGLTCTNGCGGVWVDLNSTNFPDSLFLSYLSSAYDADGNNALIGNEVTDVLTIDVSGSSSTDSGYTDLTGIKYFTNLTNVNCAYNSGIISLDLSGLSSLTNLDVTGLTGLKTLNISGCTNLTEDKITGLDTCTSLTELNVSGCTNISELNLNSNTKIETLNLSNCSALTSFVLNDNSKTYALKTLDLTGCSALENLTLNNALSLSAVECSDLTALKTIDLGGCQNVSGTLNLSNKTALTTITIGGTKVASLNVAGCSSVTEINALACSQLASVIGINDCSSLTTLMLKGTAITSLDLNSQNPSLQSLNVDNCTSLTYLDLTRSTESTTFNSLAVTGCTALKTLNLYNCKGITTLDTTTLIALEELNLTYSGVTTVNGSASTVDFSQNLNIKRIYLNGVNSFAGFDVSDNMLLEEFALSDNSNVMTLDFSSNAKLKNLNLSDASSLNTLDISACTALESLNLLNTGLTSLSVTGSDALTQFWVYNNTSLASISLTGGANLTSVKLSAGMENTVLTNLAITNCGITSLDVTYLTAITSLDVSGCSALTAITGLDNLMLLENFNATGSGIENIDASMLTNLSTLAVDDMSELESLNISNTAVASLSLNGCSSLKHFYVNNNADFDDFTNVGLTSLTTLVTVEASNSDVSDSSAQLIVQTLGNSSASEPQSLDLSGNTAITSLDITNCTSIGSLNASGCTGLSTFTTGENTALTDLNLSGCTNLTELDVSLCTALENLNASGIAIEVLDLSYSESIKVVDVSNCTSMTTLAIAPETNDNLTSLDVSGCTAMTDLQIDNSTALENLNLSGLTSLTSIYLYGTTGLKTVDVSNTNVGSLDLSGCSNITSVVVTGSRISSGGVTLPAGKDESIITGLGT